MSAWLLLTAAVVSEVAGTVSLRVAATGRRAWYAAVAAGYGLALVLLSATLAAGMPLGTAYGIWAALGVALTALASRLLFGETITPRMGTGLVLIGLGVLLVETGAGH
jgi:small multidrug resistance pump